MFDVGGGELLLIVIAILLFFGPKKLPELARTLGKGMAQIRKAQTEFERNIHGLSKEIEQSASLDNKPPRAAKPAGDKCSDTAPSAIAAKPGPDNAAAPQTDSGTKPETDSQTGSSELPAPQSTFVPRPVRDTISRKAESPESTIPDNNGAQSGAHNSSAADTPPEKS